MTTPTGIAKSDDIWFKNIGILVSPERFIEFFPNKEQTLEEKLNSIVRLGIYGSILVSMYKRNPNYLIWILVFLSITYVMYKYKPEEFTADLKTNGKTKPTINNPFMNPTLGDNPNRGPAEPYYDDTERSEEIKADIKKKFNFNLYQDIEDVFDRRNSQRQFYTMPSTTVPNDQDAFKNFLFGGMKSCKSDTGACVPYQDLRRNPPIFGNPNVNPVTEKN